MSTEGKCTEALLGPSGGVELIETEGVLAWNGPESKIFTVTQSLDKFFM